ncbi:6-bladed beta-propeller [Parabacteroides sp. AF17-28]|mgnify:CR=1 FL=1|uniref:6-bladed beta-propeller n=1 Tax=Parabacteroides sp. AF17-28 TaxID=2292241 RepID=UPI000EFF0074|nr:6-bladed beta-propeller [Parabacteroides sp. AF17-28]RHR53916.1 6-bladed beta-propeller [Parabacteroides sp. AF17-28]
MKTLLPFLLLFLFANCNSKNNPDSEKEDNGQPLCIDLAGNINNTVASLPLSEAAEKVDIVRLETSDKSFIRGVEDIEVTTHDIFVFDRNEGIFRFDRQGKFLNKVGKKGEGPEEILSIWQMMINEAEEEVYLYSLIDKNCIKVYNFDGSFKRVALRNRMENTFYGPSNLIFSFKHYFFLQQELPVLFIENNPEIWSFALTDSCFNIQKKFYNPSLAGKDEEIIQNCAPNYGWKNYWMEGLTDTDTYNQQLIMKYAGVDTIYQYNENNQEFEPYYTILSGEQPSFEMAHQWIKDPAFFKFLWVYKLFDTQEYLYLLAGKSNVVHTFRYDKQSGKIAVAKKESTIIERPFPGSPNFVFRELRKKFQLQNDISGGGDFSVDYKSQGKYWIDECTPSDLLEQIDVDGLKTGKVKDEAARDKLVQVLSTIAEDDNPVLFIATLK